MKTMMHKKCAMLVAVFICLTFVVLPVCTTGIPMKGTFQKTMTAHTVSINQKTTATEYWALLFAVGMYYNHPEADRPEMLEACDNLYNVLVDSPQQWQPDHIHVLKASQATGQNLIKELIWLIKSADSDDMVLVYLTTHGMQLQNKNGIPVDLPPKDEADGSDEILIMYNGFDKWYGFIWDDLLNFLLNLIKAKGVCLIVDSCYSGGFNDPPFTGISHGYTADSFTKGFVEDVAGQNRIVLMSSEQDELSYGSVFSDYLTSGFQGWADFFGNQDGINSAEESFNFAKPFVELETGGEEHPTILDLYPGEFPITMSP